MSSAEANLPKLPGRKSLHFLAAAMYGPIIVLSVILDLVLDLKMVGGMTDRLPTATLWGLATGLSIVVFTILLSRFFRFQRRLELEFHKILGNVSLFSALWLAFFSGVAEEFLFRGVIQHYVGWVGTGIVFGLFHFPASKAFIPWTVFALAVGLLLGYLYAIFPNILLVVVAHFTVNAINLWRLGRLRPEHANSEGRAHADLH